MYSICRRLSVLCTSALILLQTFHVYAESVTGSFLRDKAPVATTLSLEIAHTAPLRSLGLMYRKELTQDSGMLFIYPDEAQRSFWMKNTYIPLDIIFLDKNLTVQGIVTNATPRSLSPQHVPNIKSMYVLEINGGHAKKFGILSGDVLVVDKTLPKPEPGP